MHDAVIFRETLDMKLRGYGLLDVAQGGDHPAILLLVEYPTDDPRLPPPVPGSPDYTSRGRYHRYVDDGRACAPDWNPLSPTLRSNPLVFTSLLN